MGHQTHQNNKISASIFNFLLSLPLKFSTFSFLSHTLSRFLLKKPMEDKEWSRC
ncbi:hypothetical protein BVRB_7g157770 [Beta vulgaris subsp. vulgaris]|nr:hypothetical protein BVRB_7g157770 [Beta vulgaris subsp. vulgaris]